MNDELEKTRLGTERPGLGTRDWGLGNSEFIIAMISVDSTFNTEHSKLAKRPLYYLEIDEVDVAFTAFPRSALSVGLAQGYGIQAYGAVGYGF